MVHMKVLAVAKQAGGVDEKEVLDTFLNSEDLEEIKEKVKSAGDRIYLSWASVDVRDKDGERIPIDELIAEQDTLLERGGPITDQHTNAVVGKTLAYKVLEHPKANGKLGILHLNKIYDHNPTDDKVWLETTSGKRTGSSVGGDADPEKVHYELDKETGQLTRILGGFKQYETANVVSPANPLSLNEAVSMVAKSESMVKKGREALFKELSARTNISREEFDSAYKAAYEAEEEDEPEQGSATGAKKETGETDMKGSKESTKKSEELEAIFKKMKMEEELSEEERELLLEAAAVPVENADEADEESEEEEKSTKGEDAQSDIEGEADAPAPETPDPEASNDFDVAKEIQKGIQKEMASLKKELLGSMTAQIQKSTSRPSSPEKARAEAVKKAKAEMHEYALKIAKGENIPSWNAVHHQMRNFNRKAQKEAAQQ